MADARDCRAAGETMKVIAVIERLAVVRKIFKHLGLDTVTPTLRAPPDKPDSIATDQTHAWSCGT